MCNWSSTEENDHNDDNEELEKLAVDDLEREDIAVKIAGEDPTDGDNRKLSGKEALSEMRRRTKNGLHLSYLCMIHDESELWPHVSRSGQVPPSRLPGCLR